MKVGCHSWHAVTVLCAVFLCCVSTVIADISAGERFLLLKESLGATRQTLEALKADLPGNVNRSVELTGLVSGIAHTSDIYSFILQCGEDSLLVKSGSELPVCIQNGNTIRVLIRIGPGCIASLSDITLLDAAYDYDVTQAENARAQKAIAKPAPVQPTPPKATAPEPRSFLETRQKRAIYLSSRAMSIYEPYRKAVAAFNPRLTQAEADTIAASILAFCDKYDLDPRLAVAMILVESGFRPYATSPKGAMGLGQLMPGTARGLGVRNAYDPVQNVEASIRLLKGLLNKYGDLYLALSAYNAGSGAVRKYGGIPPYRETQNYIRKVVGIYQALCGN